MMCEEARELITALVDHELSGPDRAAIESHLKQCSTCGTIYEQERVLKRETRMAGSTLRAPLGLREKILADQRILPERAGPFQAGGSEEWGVGTLLQPVFVLALLVLSILPALYWMRPPAEPISSSILDSHKGIVGGTLAFTKAGSSEEIMDQLSRSVEGRFAPMGYDLSMVSLRPVGGTVQEISGRKVLITVYEGIGSVLTCFTFLGTEDDAPGAAQVFFDPGKKITFYTFSREGMNGVLHREGNLICILVSKMPMPDLLALARAKAQPS